MPTTAVVLLLAMVLLVVVSGPRALDPNVDIRYRIIHGVVVAVAMAVGIWTVIRSRRR